MELQRVFGQRNKEMLMEVGNVDTVLVTNVQQLGRGSKSSCPLSYRYASPEGFAPSLEAPVVLQ